MKLIWFTAVWCQPCKQMKERFGDKLPSDLPVEYVNVDDEAALPLMQRYNVRAVPTFVLEKEGIVMKQASGTINLTEWIKNVV